MEIWESMLHAGIVFSVRLYKQIEKGILYLLYPFLKGYFNSKLRVGKIQINGTKPRDVQIHSERDCYIRVANNPSLGLGETYMEGHWDCEKLDDLLYHIFKYKVYEDIFINRFINYLLFQVCNLQTKVRAWEVGVKQYDTGKNLKRTF